MLKTFAHISQGVGRKHISSVETPGQPVSPLLGSLDELGAVYGVVFRCSGMIVGGSGPHVAGIASNVTTESPGRKLIGITTCVGHIFGRDCVFGQFSQIACVELHRSHVIGAVGVLHVLTRLAVFHLRNCQNNIRRHVILHGGNHRAYNALFDIVGLQVRDTDVTVDRAASAPPFRVSGKAGMFMGYSGE